MTLVRLCKSRYSPKDATGALLHGGRWNSPGYAVLYAASTLALACLEALVHLRDVGLIPTDYVYTEIEVPEPLIAPWNLTGEEALGKIESQVLSREFGDEWLRNVELTDPQKLESYLEDMRNRFGPELVISKGLPGGLVGRAPVHAVPSVIIPREMNYLISPTHPEFDQLVWSEPQPFHFDPRLIGATAE